MSASTFLYASAVDTLTELGLQITMLSQRKEATFLIAVPIPVQSFVPPSRQKGTSAPTFSPISLISAGLSIVPNLELLDIRRSAEKVSCAVRKDGGDDPDVTDKALIYAEVTFGTEEGIVIDGGFGVGRVTKPGLDQPVGNAAINHVPRQMIRENVEEIQKKLDDFRALHNNPIRGYSLRCSYRQN
mgnify:CR=1 FL=1